MELEDRMKSWAGLVVGGILLVTLLAGCSVPEAAVHAERSEEVGDDVLAMVGDVKITEAEVEDLMAAQLMRVEQERYNLIKQGVDSLVADRLLEAEALQRSVSVEALLAEEIESVVVVPTDAEVDAFYEERKARIRQPKEEVADQIRDYLTQQRESEIRSRLVSQLKQEHGYRLMLQPIRLPVDAEGFPAKGPGDAPVTIVEFSDFECPYCSRVNPALQQVMERYSGRVRLVFRQFPLNIHANAQKAAEASLCAQEQGKFWEMHDVMFKEQRSLGADQLKEKAARLGLDAAAFNECLDSSQFAEAVAADLEAGGRLGVTGTPALFINGRFLSGAQPFNEIAKVIDEELAMQKAGS
jgi:protein-disulfide isomerase